MKSTTDKKNPLIESIDSDTIVAVSTAPGVSAIGIVRLSGPQAVSMSKKIFRPSAKKKNANISHLLVHGHIYDNKSKIDEVLVSAMRAPKTYTAEDVVEINCHGGIAATRNVLRLVLNSGARLAEPGEFTKRAYLNGRIDLVQAEAVADMIQAKSDMALRQAQVQLEGSLSKTIQQIRGGLLSVLAQLQASLDFSDEDIETETHKSMLRDIQKALKNISGLLETKEKGRLIKSGVKVAIIGAPNVGKSSLLNALLRKERAIVTAVAGTTRDLIEESLNVSGLEIVLQDTAGIRSTSEEVEKIGIKISKKTLSDADIVLTVFDSSKKLSSLDKKIISLAKEKNSIGILNKADLKQKTTKKDLAAQGLKKTISTSALSGKGTEAVVLAVTEKYLKNDFDPEDAIVNNERQIAALENGYNHLLKAELLFKNDGPEEIISLEIKEALHVLGLIVGEVTDEDVLDKIFSTFCIGK